jgi:signal transduction histidine kinase
VVRAHGGDKHIRNMPGTGYVFIVEIPSPTGATASVPMSG